VIFSTAAFVACRFPSAGAKIITGDIYGKDEREAVIAIHRMNKLAGRAISCEIQSRYEFPIHVYPALDYDGQLKLNNWDHGFNPMSAGKLSQEGLDSIVFYFVTEQNLESMFGMDVDGDDIMLVKQSDFVKVGFTDEDVEAARHQAIEKRRERFNEIHEYLLHKCRLPAYINNAVELAIESGLVVQPEKETMIWNLK
jgi:hypothetical protein